MLDQQYHEELRALRNLERAVRACCVAAALVPGKRQTEILAVALKEVVNARKTSIRRSKFVPFK
ncbi:MAG TPA: hypothetical protein VGU61_21690 [Noviherbaspirillum sp.]|jgi:hypothetical protein|uniref:hypothetical protein n=1 Tax=Noviherbaspirillum sp. TaxID=1926288 RepID=UPI002DDD8212|nr:hypothetical protein [Noviherbaspirillum sp.]HEV2612887.1 hypothetical protein [Noviherbaspirillum sp.]